MRLRRAAADRKAVRRLGDGRLTHVGLIAVFASLVLIVSALPAAAASATWTPTSVPASIPADPLSQFSSVSCTSPGDCSAVGDFVAGSSDQQALVATEASGKWSAGTMPVLPTASPSGSLLDSVSCVSPGNCAAVGDYVDTAGQFGLLLTETKGTWGKGTTVSLPSGSGTATYTTVLAVSCTSVGNCSAVGDYEVNGTEEGLLLTQTAGKWGTGVEVAPPSGGQLVFLYDVSCASAGKCGAVGTYFDSSGNTQGLLLTETSDKWAAGVEAKLPSGAAPEQQITLPSISCPSAGDCSAAGSYVDSLGNRQGLLLSEASGKWGTGVKATLPRGADATQSVFLRSISCATAGNCGAVGDFIAGSGATDPLLLTDSAGKWATGVKGIVPKGADTNPDAAADDVSCRASGDCTAAGSYFDSSEIQQGVTFAEAAGTWASGLEAKPPTGATSSYLEAVSCASPGDCTAGGGYVDVQGNSQLLAIGESAGSVQAGSEVTSPAGYPWRMEIATISCPTTTACVGVGEIQNGVVYSPNLPMAAIISESGGKWTMESPRLPVGPDDSWLTSVSCSSAGNCGVVGASASGFGVPSGVLLTETAGKWGSGVTPTLPAGAQPPTLGAISCAATGDCTAVGEYEVLSPPSAKGLLLTETAGKWAAGVAPSLPGGLTDSPQVTISAVSCKSPGDCTAVGDYDDSSGNQHGLLLTETSGKWSTGTEATLPSNAAPDPSVTISSVSCTSPGNCTAVGSYFDTSGVAQGLILTETSGKWSDGANPALPTGATSPADDFLTSVSCATAGNCTAVGGYFATGHVQEGLAVTETSGKWSNGVETPLPTAAKSSLLVAVSSVSCSAPGDCAAVGYTELSATDEQGLLLNEAGGKWSAVAAPLPTGAGSGSGGSLASVACPGTGDCAAVGSYVSAGGGALVETSGTLTAKPT